MQEVITEALAVVVIGNPIPMEGEAEMTGEPELEEPGEPPPPTATIPWTGREYVYAPLSAAGAGPGHGGGASAVDDFIAQVDNAEAWVFMIQDVHGDVVALASETGAILARYAYDGFGRILLSEHDAAGTGPQGTQSIKATANRVGHKGLFFDRYDTPHGWTPGSGIDGLPPTLAAPGTGPANHAGSWASGGVKGLYYNRSRHFSPNLGRFVQRDPNATGLVLAATPAMHGQQIAVGLQPFDTEFHYIDGPNTHAIYGGSPTLFSDPMGLFSLGELSAMGGIRGIQSDYDSEVLEAGQSIFGMLAKMFFSAGFEQLLDATWASDWVEPDDLYSKSSEFVTGTGSWAGRGEEGEGETGSHAVAGWKDNALPSWMKNIAESRTPSGMGVYVVANAAGEIVYVGRSKNLAARMGEHRRDRFSSANGYEMIAFNMSRYGATRALEDALIRHHNTIGKTNGNKINGMSERNRKGAKGQAYYRELMDLFK